MPVKIFLCYAREDEPLLKKLETHLKLLERTGLIDVWYDRDINSGTDWEQQIKSHLNEAQIILLLVSPDFMASDYCYGIEMKRALERHSLGEARVIPIILRYVDWEQGVLGKLQALPKDGRPVKSWPDIDQALYSVAEGIRKVVEKTMLKPSSSFPTIPALPIKTDRNPQQFLPNSDTSQFQIEQRLFNQSQQSQYYLQDGKTQANLFIQPPNFGNQEWISSTPEISASKNLDIEALYNEAVIAQFNGNLERALELYQHIGKLNSNFKKVQLTSKLKKLLEQLVSEANDRKDLRNQARYLKELLKLDPGNIIVQNRLEKVSLTYLQLLRKRATSAREGSNWEDE